MKAMRIESAGNTEEEAKMSLALIRQDVLRGMDAQFGEIATYGNFEAGYKLVQYYKRANKEI